MFRSNAQETMRIGMVLAVALVGLTIANPFLVQAATDQPSRLWTFDTDAPGTLPKEFVIGTLFDGRPAGDWKVVQDSGAPSSPNVVGQMFGKGAEHAYKVVLIDGTKSSNLEVEVSFLAVDGKADMGGGIIWRAADDRNYYLVQANPLEQNIRIYRVINLNPAPIDDQTSSCATIYDVRTEYLPLE